MTDATLCGIEFTWGRLCDLPLDHREWHRTTLPGGLVVRWTLLITTEREYHVRQIEHEAIRLP